MILKNPFQITFQSHVVTRFGFAIATLFAAKESEGLSMARTPFFSC